MRRGQRKSCFRWSIKWGESMKKAGLMLATAALLLTGCSSGKEVAVKSTKIGVTLYDQYDTFIAELMQVFKSSTLKKESENGVAISLEILDASGSQTTQNEQVRTLIEKGCDVICVNLVDRTEPTTITDMAEKNDIPIIFFNRELVAEDLERWSKLYYVGADAFDSGRLEGALAADAFLTDAAMDKNQDGICQYVVLEGEAGHQDAIVRTECSVNMLLESGVQVEKLGYAIANWNRAQARTKTASLLAQYPGQMELILANNDDMALGAIDALKAAGLPKDEWPAVVGIDGTDPGLEAVEKEEMIGTVYNDKEGQANGMLDLAFALATGEGLDDIELEGDRYIRMPYQKVTKENVSEFQKIN